ncbi:MAG: tripartite tricarboxylate transporter TctB family protein [Acetobacteraceae bacterium]|nr:tripartite tricarboxylate transporter TctB family protein [Acetobacteraceae bacterium]
MSYLQATRIRKLFRTALPGLLLAGLGIGALLVALGQPFRLPSGRPGAGFVPALLAGILIALGLLHAFALRAAPPESGGTRAGFLLCAAIAAFALLLPWAGFLPAAWAAGSLSLAAGPGARPAVVVAGGGAIGALAAALFLGALGVPTPLIGSR